MPICLVMVFLHFVDIGYIVSFPSDCISAVKFKIFASITRPSGRLYSYYTKGEMNIFTEEIQE